VAAKSGREYADDVRELRAQGVDFPSAADGYILADAANWSSGQKAAVTRAINEFDFTEFDAAEAAREIEPSRGLDESEVEAFFDDSAGDADEEWDDLEFFDEGEADEFVDEEGDDYEDAE
jgi:hypothetical protein